MGVNFLSEIRRQQRVEVNGVFGLPSAAYAAIERYRGLYSSQHYDTMLAMRQDSDTDQWIVEGSRLAVNR